MTLRRAYWLIFAATLAVYALMLVWTLPVITSSAGGLRPFDLRPGGYTTVEAQAFVDALSARGRALYLGPQRLLDLAYPGLLALVLAGATLSLMANRRLRGLFMVTIFLGMVADYGENIRVAEMLRTLGRLDDELVKAASTLTQAKSVLTGLAMIGVLLAAAVTGWRAWGGRP